MTCPNCGSYRRCYCTGDEMGEASKIIRQRGAEYRRKTGTPTVIEAEHGRQCRPHVPRPGR